MSDFDEDRDVLWREEEGDFAPEFAPKFRMVCRCLSWLRMPHLCVQATHSMQVLSSPLWGAHSGIPASSKGASLPDSRQIYDSRNTVGSGISVSGHAIPVPPHLLILTPQGQNEQWREANRRSKGKQSNTEASCQTSPPLTPLETWALVVPDFGVEVPGQ